MLLPLVLYILCALYLDVVMEAAPFHDAEVLARDAYGNQDLMTGDSKDDAWAGYEEQALIEWSPQGFSKHIDSETGYYFYENSLTGERHWDTPLEGVAPLQPKPPREEDAFADTAREERQRVEKETRRRDMVKRRAIFDRQLLEGCKEADAAESARVEALWDRAEETATRKGGDFSLAWQRVPGVSENHLFGFYDRHAVRLASLRLVGLGLVEVPGAIGEHLWSLKQLSFSSNVLEAIPDELCNLTGLTDLNLVRNKLVALPDRLGNLLRLRSLSLAGNRLETIPPSFGNLVCLDRVVLDCNCLRRLPETLGRMKCRWFNVSNNKLVGLPHCLKEMPRLNVLSVVNNGLRSLPSDIGDSRSITELHLASNRLTQLPDSICSLKTLKVLWLDHNFIAGLPMKFHELEGLERLMLERNDMVYPPTEVIQVGCDRVRAWCSRRMHDRVMARKHTIVLAVQDILNQVETRGLGDPSCFQAGVQLENNSDDLFYALVYERFWDALLPALERAWEEGPAGPRGCVTSFGYARAEVDSVLLSYRDPTGRILRTKTQMFRRCACIGDNGRRRVCVPPKAGWMCERKATLIKHDIILEREQDERQRQAREKEDIEFRVRLARRLVKDASESKEGKKKYNGLAVKMAEELKKKKELGEFESQEDAMKAHRRQTVEKKFAKVKKSLAKDREHRLEDLKAKAAALGEELKTLRGWAKEQKEAQIDQVMRSMETMPEDAKIAEIDRQLEEEVTIMEEKAAAMAAKKTRKIVLRKVRRGDKEFQELVDEMVADILQRDMDSAGQKARRKAEHEHKVFRNIMEMWIGLGMRESFAEWKTWTKKRIKQRRRDARTALRQAWHRYEAEGVVSVMAEWKASFWEENYDIYNDSPYWVHKDTGETTTERPTVEKFIPAGYEMPKPPSQRLEDMSDSDSSGDSDSDDSSDISAREGGRREKKRGRDSRGSDTSPALSFASGSSRSSSSDGTMEQADASAGSATSDERGSGSESGTNTGSERSSDASSEPVSGADSSSSSSSQSQSGSGTSGGSTGSPSSTASPLLRITDGRKPGGGDGGRATGSAPTLDDTTLTIPARSTETDGIGKDSAESLALQITDGKASAGGARQSSEDAISSLTATGLGRNASSTSHRNQTRSTPGGLVELIKDKAGQAKEVAIALIQGSEGDDSSVASSLRTEKPLERQKEWEVDHARARAQRLREESRQEFDQELRVRREKAAAAAEDLAPKEHTPLTVDEVISSVGWDPSAEYTSEELDAFAGQAMKQMAARGTNANADLSRFGNKPQ